VGAFRAAQSHPSRRTPQQIATYKVEPYVVAADVYAVAPHTGRGGWTWYTGSAGWMYRLLIETLLGVNLEGDQLRLTPGFRKAGRPAKSTTATGKPFITSPSPGSSLIRPTQTNSFSTEKNLPRKRSPWWTTAVSTPSN
jgi:hypothetical protein